MKEKEYNIILDYYNYLVKNLANKNPVGQNLDEGKKSTT